MLCHSPWNKNQKNHYSLSVCDAPFALFQIIINQRKKNNDYSVCKDDDDDKPIINNDYDLNILTIGKRKMGRRHHANDSLFVVNLQIEK